MFTIYHNNGIVFTMYLKASVVFLFTFLFFTFLECSNNKRGKDISFDSNDDEFDKIVDEKDTSLKDNLKEDFFDFEGDKFDVDSEVLNPEDPVSDLPFSFAIITDLHVGEGYNDYGEEGYEDQGGVDYEITRKLIEAIEKINSRKEAYNIKFVAVLGDITDSGERSEFEKARELLEQLEVPYVPVIGNHDIWPYTRGSSGVEAPIPIGDRYFLEVFSEQLDELRLNFPNFVMEVSSVFNPECSCYSYFINYAFDFEGYHFVVLDFVSRTHAILGPGAGPDADLYDFDGGSWRWFSQHLDSYPNKGDHNVIVFVHHPPIVNFWGLDSFSQGEYDKMDSFIRERGYGDLIFGFFSGHLHKNEVRIEYAGQYVVITGATKDNSTIRIVKISSEGNVEFENLF